MIKKIAATTIILTGALFADGQNVATMTNVKASLEALIDAFYRVDKKQNGYDKALKDVNITLNGEMIKLINSMDTYKTDISKQQDDLRGDMKELKAVIYTNDNSFKKCGNMTKEDEIIANYLLK